ncbi:MAG TPA: hypothetical protein VFQ22_09305, partial [Longimicrobiales bacterium]|nr:hypothetical protein [Longimicrobiales bacterium]
EILQALKERGSRIPVIAISGGGRLDTGLLLDSANLLGAVRTLEKPFALEDLRRAVDSALEDVAGA